jgi:hypothetical protein
MVKKFISGLLIISFLVVAVSIVALALKNLGNNDLQPTDENRPNTSIPSAE